jgi:aryl sulfotransferase
MSLWNTWTSKASFDWESDGYPHWSASHHAQTGWDHKELPYIQFVHYADLLNNPSGEISNIAQFLNIGITDTALADVVHRVSLESMRANSEAIMGGTSAFWEGGAKRFLHKGSNGRRRDVLTNQDLKAYEAMIERTLGPDCAASLEQGWTAL